MKVTGMETPGWLWRVLDTIEAELKDQLSPSRLARLTPYSSRHFQRIFKRICGEGVMEYTRARRLTCAMQALLGGKQRILDIALDYQFESQEAFTRAFQARFAFPPRRFHNQKLINPPASKARICEQYLNTINNELFSQEPVIRVMESMTCVGVVQQLPLDQFDSLPFSMVSEMSAQLEQILPSSAINALIPHGVNIDENLTILSYRAPPEQRAEMDGINILVGRETTALINGLVSLKTPQQKYAVFTLQLDPQEFVAAIHYITGTWFPRSMYWIGNAPIVCKIPQPQPKGRPSTARIGFPLRERRSKTVDQWWQ